MGRKHEWGPGPDGDDYHCGICRVSRTDDYDPNICPGPKYQVTRAELIASLTLALEALPEEEMDQLLAQAGAAGEATEVRFGETPGSLGLKAVSITVYEQGRGVRDVYVNVYPLSSGWEFKAQVGRKGVEEIASRTMRNRGKL